MNGTQQVGTMRRIYPYRVWEEALFLTIVVALGVGGLAINYQRVSSFSPSILSFYAFLLAVSVYMLVMAYHSFLAIEGDRIEVRGDFGEHTASLNEIEGFRTVHTRRGYFRELILKEGRGKITISDRYDTDDDFRDWLHQVPDLDKRDSEALLTEIEKEKDLGSTPQERLRSLDRAWQVAAAVLAVEVLAGAGLNFAPWPWHKPSAVLLIVAPFVAAYLCWRFPLLYAVFRTRTDPRADFGYALMIAGFGLCFFTSQLHFVSLFPLLMGMGLLGLAAALVYYQPTRSGAKQGALLSVLALIAIYAYGTVAVSDIVFDNSAPTQYSVRVLGSEALHGRGSTTYDVHIAPWGPFEAEEDVKLSPSEFDPNENTVCINLFRGWLMGPWFQAVDCDAPPNDGPSQ